MSTAFGWQKWSSENTEITKLVGHIVEQLRNNHFRNESVEWFTQCLSSLLLPFTSALLTKFQPTNNNEYFFNVHSPQFFESLQVFKFIFLV